MSKFIRDGVPRKDNGKIDFRPKTHHAHYLLLVVLGFLLPPLAVAARFGIGKDFFINVVLTCCGYIPGHGHNFFVQNIRDNRNAARTPKWAIRYGLVDTNYLKKQKKSRQWVGRYNDQLPERTMYDDDGNAIRYESHHRFEDGDGPPAAASSSATAPWKTDSGLVERDEYYNGHDGAAGGSRNSSSRDFYGSGAGGAAGDDPYSLRRRRSEASLGGAGNGASGQGSSSATRSKSRSKGFLGRKKADRHARSGEVMGAAGGAGGRDSASYTSSIEDRSHSVDAEGPESVDDRYGPNAVRKQQQQPSASSSRQQQYGSSSGYAGKSPSSAAPAGRVKNDGLDHTF